MKNDLKKRTVDQLIILFGAKAPVCLCTPRPCMIGYCGPQRLAARARAELARRGIQIPPGVSTAISHALHVGEGREELDTEISKGARSGCREPPRDHRLGRSPTAAGVPGRSCAHSSLTRRLAQGMAKRARELLGPYAVKAYARVTDAMRRQIYAEFGDRLPPRV